MNQNTIRGLSNPCLLRKQDFIAVHILSPTLNDNLQESTLKILAEEYSTCIAQNLR